MKLPLTRQSRNDESRAQELQELLEEIDSSEPEGEPSAVVGHRVLSSFMNAIERRASALGMATDQLLSDYATRIRESKYPTAECLEPEQIQSIIDAGGAAGQFAEHLATCLPCQQVVSKSSALSPTQLEGILADIRIAAPQDETLSSNELENAASYSTKLDDVATGAVKNRSRELGVPAESSAGSLKVIVAEKEAIFRSGVAKILAVEDYVHIVAQAETPEQILTALDKFHAAVLVIGGFHTELSRVLLAANKVRTRVVMLGDSPENARQYVSAGAHGVIYRNVTSSALVDCVRKVALGETWIQDIASPSELIENDMVGLRVRDRLTARELRIVALIVQGYKNKEIATQLGTTEQVIKNYLRNVYDKIGVSDRFELTLFAISHRLISERSVGAALTSRAYRSSTLQW